MYWRNIDKVQATSNRSPKTIFLSFDIHMHVEAKNNSAYLSIEQFFLVILFTFLQHNTTILLLWIFASELLLFFFCYFFISLDTFSFCIVRALLTETVFSLTKSFLSSFLLIVDFRTSSSSSSSSFLTSSSPLLFWFDTINLQTLLNCLRSVPRHQLTFAPRFWSLKNFFSRLSIKIDGSSSVRCDDIFLSFSLSRGLPLILLEHLSLLQSNLLIKVNIHLACLCIDQLKALVLLHQLGCVPHDEFLIFTLSPSLIIYMYIFSVNYRGWCA